MSFPIVTPIRVWLVGVSQTPPLPEGFELASDLPSADVAFGWLGFPDPDDFYDLGRAEGLGKPVWVYQSETWATLSPRPGMHHEHCLELEAGWEDFCAEFPFWFDMGKRLQRAKERACAWRAAATGRLGGRPVAISKGYIYFLQMGDAVKIGKTYSIDQRIDALTVNLPEPAAVIHTLRCSDMDAAEVFFHELFALERCRRAAEWFRLTPRQVEWVLGLGAEWRHEEWL